MTHEIKSVGNSVRNKIIATAVIAVSSFFLGAFIYLLLMLIGLPETVSLCATTMMPLVIPIFWIRGKWKWIYSGFYGVFVAIIFVLIGVQIGRFMYLDSVTVNVTPNINVREYLPFDEDSKIVKYDSKTLKLTENLPIIDGATAAFPVYSAFVNAVYPDTTRLYDGFFEYNNTVDGYRKLAEKKTDIFLGAYPSKEQLEYAAEQGTEFDFTQIGSEAFVFFVHKDNPINSLTTEQIQGIYSGKITNWKELGGSDERIAAFQRNQGSGSQSMLIRFMGDVPIMEPELEEVNGFMGGIIEDVANYRSESGSIGFSFRFYVEGIIRHPDIKMIAIDGVAPTVENIKNGTYPIIAPVYAVTYVGNDNPNVQRLIDWMLTEEGQYIIEKTGYAGVGKDKES